MLEIVAILIFAGVMFYFWHRNDLRRLTRDYSCKAPFDGDLEDYAQWLTAQTSAADASAASGSDAAAPADSAEARRQRRREDAQRRAALSPLKAQLAQLETQLDALARDTAQVQAALTAAELYAEGAKPRLRELLERQTQLARDTQRVEAQWLKGGEALESLQRSLSDLESSPDNP